MTDRFRTVILDFDYTLADSSYGVMDCINHALSAMGLSTADYPSICKTIGLPLQDALVALAGAENESRTTEFTRLFVQKADQVMMDKTTLYGFVPTTIAELRHMGLNLGIVSTKFARRINRILERENLRDSFDVIVGGEDVRQHKPDPESLQLAIRKLESSRQNTLYVGDSITDAQTAQRATVSFVGVLSGVTPREAFVDYPAIAVLDNVAALPDWLGASGAAAGKKGLKGRDVGRSSEAP